MKPTKAKAVAKQKPVKKSVSKKTGSKIPAEITLNPPRTDRRLTTLLAACASYGYWHGLFSLGNAEPFPSLDPETAKYREEVQAAIHKGFEEGRGRRTGEKNKPMEPPRIEQD